MNLKRLLIYLGAVMGIVLFGTFFSAASDGTAGEDQFSSKENESYTLTLITGDQLDVHIMENGKMSIDMLAKEGERQRAFHKVEKNGNVYVIPTDIYEYVPNKIDEELFNVTGLIEQGYDDEHMDELPLIVSFKNIQSMNDLSSEFTTSLADQHAFSSIDAVAAKVEKDGVDQFNQSLFSVDGETLQANHLLENNIENIQLDKKVHINLKDSVPATGAPESWDTGYDGSGVEVAVLDSGIDRDHPDFEGKISKEKNFTDDEDASDLHGHGTHVASIIAGFGVASEGEYQGVAPGANLINGKVMDGDGNGSQSNIIKGMEWATEEGADVINMSIGSSPTDGTDPISEAVNILTEEKDVLFVVSAGNDGPGEETISAPGTADAALTVGNVNVSNELADTSSRGPRIDDYAITLDLTAPGTDITAARANGTSMGTPLNDHYTETSGTSMAAPHVAGATALLINKWNDEGEDQSPAELKSQLVATATPNDENTIYEQGGGMVDVEQAVEQDIMTNQVSLDMGYFEYPHDERDLITETITYSNTSDEDITLHLSAVVEDSEGEEAPDEMITTSEAELTIAAGETEEIDVTLDTSLGNNELYGGYVTAEFDEQAIRTPVGFYKEEEVHTLTIQGITRDGKQVRSPESTVQVIDVEDPANFEREVSTWDANGEVTVRLQPGMYSVMGGLQDTEGELTLVGNPEVTVEEDTTVVLDGQKANEVNVNVEDDVEAKIPEISYYRGGEVDGSYNKTFSLADGGDRLFAAPTESVEMGDFEFYTDWEFVSPEDGAGDPYYYRLLYPESDAIPSDLSYDVDIADLVQNETSYYAHKEGEQYEYTQSKWRPYETVSFNKRHSLDAGQVRTEYFIPSDTTKYSKNIYIKDETGNSLHFNEPDKYYKEKGHYKDSWMKQPVHSSVKVGNPPISSHNAVSREGNKLTVMLSEYMDGENHYANLLSGEVELQLFEDDKLLAESDRAIGNFNLSADEADYRLRLTAYMDEDMSPFSSQSETNWTFRSKKPEDGVEYAVPMLTVDYDLDLDLFNRASLPEKPGGTTELSFSVQQQPLADDIPVENAQLWLSYNDGEDWTEVEDITQDGKGKFTADIADIKDNREGSGYVSLKVEAEDVEGNGIEQEIIRAYQWNFNGDITGNDMVDIHDIMRAVAFYGTSNEAADLNGDGVVDEQDMRILEKNFLKVGPGASKDAEPLERLGGKGIDEFLRSVGLEPLE